MNRKVRILPLVVAILAAAAAIGVKTFIGPCVHEIGTSGPCHWAGQAMFGTALLIGAEGLAAAFWKKNGARKGLLFSMAASAVLGTCFPGPLIDLCGMTTMRCRALMRPAMTILFAAMAVISAIGCVMSREEQV